MMDEGEIKKKTPSLPPGYVSLAQLQEQWLQKQKEKKLKEEQKQREESRNEGDLKNKKNEKDGPLVCVIEQETGKGKAIGQIGSVGNGEGKKKPRKRKKKKKHSKTAPPLVDDENENPTVEYKCGFEGVDGEMKRTNGYKNVENIGGNELIVGTLHDEGSGGEDIYGKSQGIKETITMPKVDVLPSDGVREEVSKVKSVGVRAGFGRNGRRNEVNEFQINEVEVSLEKKVVDGKGNGKDLADRGRYGDNRVSGNKKKEHRVKVNESGMSLGKKVGDEKEKVKNRRHGKKGKKITDEKEKVKDGTDKRRNGDIGEIAYSLEESGAAMQGSKGKKVELKSENRAEDEALEGDSKIDGLDGIDRNGLAGQDHRVESESLNDTTNSITAEKKAQDGDSVVDKVTNGENGKARNGIRRYRNWKGNGGIKSERQASSDLSADSTRSRKEMNVGNKSSGRLEGRKMKQNGGGMVWVKKEDK